MMESFRSTAQLIKDTLKRLLDVQGSVERLSWIIAHGDDQVEQVASSSSTAEESSNTLSSCTDQHISRITPTVQLMELC